MPNWVYNYLTVEADNETASKIHDVLTTKDEEGKTCVTYQKLIPMPKPLESAISGSLVSLGNYILFNNSSSFSCFGVEIQRDKLVETMENRLKETIVYDPTKVKDRYYKNVMLLSDVYFSLHPDKKTLTYGELADWIETVQTDEMKLKSFIDSAKDALSQSKQQMQNTLEYGYPTWYEWACANWGTKWDACHSEVLELDSSSVAYKFDSPWGIPYPVMIALSKTFPDAIFYLSSDFEMEPIVQETTWQNGVILSTSESPLEWYDEIGTKYTYEQLTSHDPYFGEWYYENDMSTTFYSDHTDTALDVNLVLTENKWTVKYLFRSTSQNENYEYGTHESGPYPLELGGIEIITTDLIKSKDVLEDKFGHLLGWWFNKPTPPTKDVDNSSAF